MKNIIACNLGSYRGHFTQEEMYSHLGKIGLTNVEISTPKPEEIQRVKKELSEYSLTATTLLANHDVKSDSFVSEFETTLKTAQMMGVSRIFLSAHSGDVEKSVIYDRLRELGQKAQAMSVTICLETHPDLANNGDVALSTMKAINHPNIGINFDTANVHYHTDRSVDTVEEAKKILNYVKAVHLKDTVGGYHNWNFPILGQGLVDFKGIFDLFSNIGFSGPYTMELEGVEGETLDRDGILAHVEDSYKYLKDIGVAK